MIVHPDNAVVTGDASEGEIQVACFRLGTEMYAVDIMRIKEIIRPQKLIPVPKAPSLIEGVINLRGAVIPVVDLRKRFDLAAADADRKARIIICVVSRKIIGLLVDEVTEVRRYTRKDVRPAPQFLQGKGSEFFLGVCRRGDEMAMLLDLDAVLTSGEKVVLEQVHLTANDLPPLQ